ncbi:MAG: hypothetical protein DRG87_11695 [Deltaproteobacteria bacterium]|nr:MAG: hypothetical protein DRG87_11695 [Deltaproteobacteria bacterium]
MPARLARPPLSSRQEDRPETHNGRRASGTLQYALVRGIEKRRRIEEAFIFYKILLSGRWICAVAKRLDGEGFLVTAYPTSAVMEGAYLWPK